MGEVVPKVRISVRWAHLRRDDCLELLGSPGEDIYKGRQNGRPAPNGRSYFNILVSQSLKS